MSNKNTEQIQNIYKDESLCPLSSFIQLTGFSFYRKWYLAL